ncbi:MAG: inositol 2-dehydrogenase [Oscillospiraceae bacterium]|nr:inositol 2-dehydrogenase [Oscillospiraceae bacterium]
MAKQVKVGIIGAGRIGKIHTTNLVKSIPGAEVVSIADPLMNDALKEWAAGLNIGKSSKDSVDIFSDTDIEAVFICSSTDTHAGLIVKAAESGKHIFCEKPIATDIRLIEEALAVVDKSGVKFQVGFMRRFDHNHKKVRDTVASGMLGAPSIVKITSRDPEPSPMEYVKVSGGIFLDMTIHDFDMARYLSGSEITEVCAYGAVLVNEEFKKYDDIDTAIIMMKFANGAIGVIDNSRRAPYGYDQRTEVHCKRGCVQVANDLNDTSIISTTDGVSCSKPTWFILERYNDAYISEATAFIDAVAKGTDVPVTGIDGLMSVKIAFAAKKSLDERRPVKISEII